MKATVYRGEFAHMIMTDPNLRQELATKLPDPDYTLIARSYDQLSFPIPAGTYCVHDNKLYCSKAEIATKESWTAEHWQNTTVSEDINKKADVDPVNAVTIFMDKSLSRITEIDFSKFSTISGFINANNIFLKPGVFNSYVIPIESAIKISVAANNTNGSIIAFLRTDTLVENSSPDFSADKPGRIMIAAGETENFMVPMDTHFLFVQNRGSSSSTSTKPEKLEFYDINRGNIEELAESVRVITQFMRKSLIEKTIDINNYRKIRGFINSSNIYKNTSGFTSDFVPLDSCTKIYIKANSNYAANLAFLTTNAMTPDAKPSFSIAYPERQMIDAGTDATFDVPDDARYVLICNKGLNSAVYNPEIVKLFVVQSGNELIEKIRADVLNSLGFVGDTTGHDVPENRGVMNAYKKAQQLLTLSWTAKRSVPTHKIINPSGGYREINADDTCRGVVYSSVREYSKLVGLMVSLRTFMTAVNNPYSLLYTETTYGDASASGYGLTYHGTNCASYFGIVCTTLVEYALGFNVYWDNFTFDYLCRIGMLEKVYDQSAYGAKLMDIYWRDGHVKLITDIIRNERGVPTQITTTESAAVLPYTTNMTPDEFDQMLERQHGIIYRYTELYKNLDYTPSEFVAVEDEVAPGYTYNDDICTFAGDYAVFHTNDVIYINYTLGNKYNKMELYKDDGLQPIATYNLNDPSQHALNVSEICSAYGTYKARLTGDGTPSDYTYFVVLDTRVDDIMYEDEMMSLNFSSENAKPVCVQICTLNGTASMIYVITPDDLKNGSCSFNPYSLRWDQYREATFGECYLRLFYRHPWGMTSGSMIQITDLT